MDFSRAIDLLEQAEGELLNQLGTKSSYEEKQRCLDYSESIHEIVNALTSFGKGTAPQSEPAALNPGTISKDSSSLDYPLYFVYEDKLWKVAPRSKGSSSLYKKSIQFSDAKSICNVIHELLSSHEVLLISDIEEKMEDIPVYRIQLTVMALVKTGLFVSVGRGKYALDAGKSKSLRKWIESLKALPVHEELLNK